MSSKNSNVAFSGLDRNKSVLARTIPVTAAPMAPSPTDHIPMVKNPRSGRKDISGKREKKAAPTLDIDNDRQGGTGLKQQLTAHVGIFGPMGDHLCIHWCTKLGFRRSGLCSTSKLLTTDTYLLLLPGWQRYSRLRAQMQGGERWLEYLCVIKSL